MSQVNIEVLHIQGLMKGFKEASEDMKDNLVKALHEAGYLIEVPAAKAVRELFEHPTGNLASSLHTEVARAELTARVGTSLEYAALREFGGTVEGAWGRATTHHTGRPYLIPAFKEARPKIEKLFEQMLDKMTSKISKRTREGR